MMSSWVPQVVGTLVSTQKAQMQKVEKVRYGKVHLAGGGLHQCTPRLDNIANIKFPIDDVTEQEGCRAPLGDSRGCEEM